MTTRLTRRAFLATGTAASVGLTIRFPLFGAPDAAAAAAFDPSPMLTITPDGLVTVHITKAEMGQGVGTALAQIVAEELEADWKDVRIDYPTANEKYGLMLTGGSWSVNWTFDALSRAGAASRLALVDAAAASWNVPAAECVAERGVVRHLSSGRSLSYGEIVKRVPITKTFSEDDLKKIALKKPADYRVVGKWTPRLDIPEKVTGLPIYVQDVRLPGMLHARTVKPPSIGSMLESVDESSVSNLRGVVKVVVKGNFVGVVAERLPKCRRGAPTCPTPGRAV